MSRRTWRGILTPKYEQPALAAEVVMTTSCFDGTRSQAKRDPALHEQEEDDNGNRDQRRRRHDLTPVDEAVAAVEVREPHGDRLLVAAVKEGVREDELVPARDEREDRRRNETRGDERQQDAHERTEPGRAVDHRGLFELLRDPDQEAAQRPDTEGQREGQVDEDHAA